MGPRRGRTHPRAAFVQAVRHGQQPRPGDPADLSAAAGTALYCAGVRLVDERLVDAAHRSGLALHVWTVDEEQEMEELVDEGVDGVMSDRPRRLCALLRRLGANYRPS